MKRGRWRLPVFFLLAYLLSWYPWFLALSRGTTTGPNPLGPLLAALLVTGFSEGRSGLKALLARLVRWRVGVRWYAVAMLMPVGICVIAAAINVLLGAPVPPAEPLSDWPSLAGRFLFIFLFIGLGEEPGWRGFALPLLQKGRSGLASSLILAPLWAIWHLPLMGSEFPPVILPPFLVSILPATLLTTWIFNRTGGSVLLPMLFHSAVNTVGAGLIFPLFNGESLVVLWYLYAGAWLLAALVVWKVWGIEPFPAAGATAPADLRETVQRRPVIR